MRTFDTFAATARVGEVRTAWSERPRVVAAIDAAASEDTSAFYLDGSGDPIVVYAADDRVLRIIETAESGQRLSITVPLRRVRRLSLREDPANGPTPPRAVLTIELEADRHRMDTTSEHATISGAQAAPIGDSGRSIADTGMSRHSTNVVPSGRSIVAEAGDVEELAVFAQRLGFLI